MQYRLEPRRLAHLVKGTLYCNVRHDHNLQFTCFGVRSTAFTLIGKKRIGTGGSC
jgi:hypothetical protein